MSTLVTNEFFSQPGRGHDVANLLLEILGESLEFDGCETIRIVRDQDDPYHVAGVTQWTERRNFEDYLAWRTERGLTEQKPAALNTSEGSTSPSAIDLAEHRVEFGVGADLPDLYRAAAGAGHLASPRKRLLA